MGILYEYYNTDDDMRVAIADDYWCAQTFTPTVAHQIISVKLELYRYGLPGTVTVGVRATDGSGHPTGSDLCSGTRDGNLLNIDPDWTWYEITLGSGTWLTADTKYAIVVRATGGDTENSVRWRDDCTSPTYTGGNHEESEDSGVNWTSWTTTDLMFEEYGTGGKVRHLQKRTFNLKLRKRR